MNVNFVFTINVHQEDDGPLWAEVAELPGCFASGEDLDELSEALNEAIQLYMEELSPAELAKLPTDGPISNVVHADFGRGKSERRPVRVAKMDLLIEA